MSRPVNSQNGASIRCLQRRCRYTDVSGEGTPLRHCVAFIDGPKQVADLECGAENVKESCSRLAKEAAKYCEALEQMAGMHEAFAAALQSFYPSCKQDGSSFGMYASCQTSCLETREVQVTRVLRGSDMSFSQLPNSTAIYTERYATVAYAYHTCDAFCI